MKRKLRRALLLAALLLTATAPGMAQAGDKETARKHFDRGVELVDDGQLAEAIVEFRRSYDLTHHFAVLYNIGQVYVSLAKPVEAVDTFAAYLAEGGKKIQPARRAEVESEIARQKARIATLEIRGLPGGATISIDDGEIGKAPLSAPVRVGVGTHIVAASAEGYEPAQRRIDLAGEDHRVVDLALVKRAKLEVAPIAAAPVAKAVESTPAEPALLAPGSDVSVQGSTEPAKPPFMGKLRIAAIAIATAGALGIGAGVGCWYLAKDRHNQALIAWDLNDDDNARELQSESLRYVRGANVSFVVGGGLVALGTVLFILGHPSAPAPAAQAHVTPVVGPNFAGLTAGGTW